PDRQPHPSLWEVRKVYQYIKTRPVDLDSGMVQVINRYDFLDLSEFYLEWTVVGDADTVAGGRITTLQLAPHDSSVVRLHIPVIHPAPGVEYFLTIQYRLKQARPFRPQGFVVAWDQFRLPLLREVPRIAIDTLAPLSIRDGVSEIVIEGERFSIVFDKATATLGSLVYGGTELVLSGPVPNFWRPPTDNDYGNGMPQRQGIWRDAGSRRVVERVTTNRVAPAVVRINVEAAIPAGGSRYYTSYTVYGSGDIVAENRFVPGDTTLPNLPRFGMTMTLPRAFDRIVWFGRGPHENYWDRNTGATVGLYQGTVMEQYHPYIRPQENGNKSDVRWVALSDDRGTGLLAVGMPHLNVSAQHFLNEDFDGGPAKRQRHTYHLTPRDLVMLNLDYRQMGVGGDNSWGARPHPEYTLPPREYFYSFRLRPFSADDPSPLTLSKLRF
ncbi:MAG: beta-galactosidase domain 4-containing protein, partial [Gemmatimonadales bacterium]